ncbi:MAG: BMC domain-containing protein [Thermoanaerobaculia bacterium]
MKRVSALAVLEYSDIPAGVYAVDAILKKAPIAFVRAGTVTRGRYLVVFGGSTASTRESFDEALAVTGGSIVDSAFLPDIHPSLAAAVFGGKRPARASMLIVETSSASSIVRAVEAALKGTGVDLAELRLSDSGLDGKGIAVLTGSLHDVEAAAGVAAAGTWDGAPPSGFAFRIIAAPHPALESDIVAAQRFDAAQLVQLDGEIG